MKTDIFEWDDATEEIVRKAVESRELDNAVEKLKNEAEGSLDSDFHQFNFEQVLRERDTVVKSIQQLLSPKLDSLEEWHDKIESREDETEFQRNRDDNAVDWEDYQNLKGNYERLRNIHSLTTIWAFVAHANSNDVAKAVDIHQMQANQNKAMEMVNENFDGIENLLDSMSKEMRDGIMRGMSDALEEVLDKPEERLEKLESKVEEKNRRIEELEDRQSDLLDPESVEPLSDSQRELYDYVLGNPGASHDEIAENTDTAANQVPLQLDRIKGKGWQVPKD